MAHQHQAGVVRVGCADQVETLQAAGRMTLVSESALRYADLLRARPVLLNRTAEVEEVDLVDALSVGADAVLDLVGDREVQRDRRREDGVPVHRTCY